MRGLVYYIVLIGCLLSCGQEGMQSPSSSSKSENSLEKVETNVFAKLQDSDSEVLPELSEHVLVKLQDIKELQTLYHNPEIDKEMKLEIAEALNKINNEVDLLKPELQIKKFNQLEAIQSGDTGYFGVFKIETSSGIQEVKIGYQNQTNDELELVILNLR
jgi:hypothetical protein